MSLTGNTNGKTLRGKINSLHTLRGYSAYELAVLNGFVGTEEAWLSSLEGEPGITPHIGDNGNWWFGTTDTGMSSKGDPFTYEDFTPEQLENLKGEPGANGWPLQESSQYPGCYYVEGGLGTEWLIPPSSVYNQSFKLFGYDVPTYMVHWVTTLTGADSRYFVNGVVNDVNRIISVSGTYDGVAWGSHNPSSSGIEWIAIVNNPATFINGIAAMKDLNAKNVNVDLYIVYQ